ncbi:MAG: hypothetical protein KatS3mg129_0707 [Leptospiraceae bacterium]|nr:MAG: hypothetical protein KatS3mg129_0707 [Leptospiraceae bacterium]
MIEEKEIIEESEEEVEEIIEEEYQEIKLTWKQKSNIS